MVHDGIVEVENDATRFATQEPKQRLLKTLSLEKQDLIVRKLTEESPQPADARGIKTDGRLDALGFEIRQILEHAIAARSHLETLNKKKCFHGGTLNPALGRLFITILLWAVKTRSKTDASKKRDIQERDLLPARVFSVIMMTLREEI